MFLELRLLRRDSRLGSIDQGPDIQFSLHIQLYTTVFEHTLGQDVQLVELAMLQRSKVLSALVGPRWLL